ncbi:MAG: type II secretion system F family protein [Noviherbaspirillum sp.]
MSGTFVVFLLVTFVAVFTGAFTLMRVLAPTSVQQRMQSLNGGLAAHPAQTNAWIERLAKVSGPFAKLTLPKEGWETSPLHTRFMNAGWRSEYMPAIFFGLKTLLALFFPLLAWVILTFSGGNLSINAKIIVYLVAASFGLYLPNLILTWIVDGRKLEIFESFPDALDLMTICIEAGLAIDAAIVRISSEMRENAPVLSEELHLVTLELRAGNSKEKALRNLAMRTGVEDVDTLVAMLIQAERFGTSIADSLRVHADGLRTRRRQRAEEAAAKVALKLLMPLIFCIFPAFMVVVAGPAIIQVTRSLLPALSGGQ